jgi:rod shape-determining protein MreD
VTGAQRPSTTVAGQTAEELLHMRLLLAVIGAIVAALLEEFPYLSIGDAHPHPVLVFGIIWAVAAGLEGALAWAFAGGIVLDALASRPLGSTAFTLLLAVGAASLISRSLARVRPLVPIVAVALLAGLHSMLQLMLYGAIRNPIAASDPGAAILPGVIYDVVLAVLFGPLIIAVHDRRASQERLDW